jgi:hypothetical protein
VGEIWGSDCDGYEDGCLAGRCAVWSGRYHTDVSEELIAFHKQGDVSHK